MLWSLKHTLKHLKANRSKGAPEDITDKERRPPPRPTPLDFPAYTPTGDTSPFTPQSINDFARLLLSIKKAQDISAHHVQALNLKVTYNASFADLLPQKGSEYLPPLGDAENDGREDTSNANEKPPLPSKLLGNGRTVPGLAKYEAIRSELELVNEDAFREVLRLPPLAGKPKLRLKESRKFWLGLEQMAQYWDTSLDQYYDTDELRSPNDTDTAKSPNFPAASDDRMQVDEGKAEAPVNGELQTQGNGNGKKQMYKGRRIGTGSDMSEEHRDETVKAFVDLVAWAFGCQTMMPSWQPRLAVQNILLPVRHSSSVSRSPQDRQIARKGILEGPVLVVQCRAELKFRETGEHIGEGQAEICDLFRETGGMLLTAQERAREGSIETRAGDGKWWTKVPRWGATEELAPSSADNDASSETMPLSPSSNGNANKKLKIDGILPQKSRPGKQMPKRLSMADKWKIVQPGPSTWDRKLRYMKIGKDPASQFDDVRAHF